MKGSQSKKSQFSADAVLWSRTVTAYQLYFTVSLTPLWQRIYIFPLNPYSINYRFTYIDLLLVEGLQHVYTYNTSSSS